MEEIRDGSLLDQLAQVSLFDDLNPNELNQIAPFMKLMRFEPGEVLFRENERGDFACFITEGIMDVCKDRGDEQVVIARLNRGKSIGEMAMFDQFNRSAMARAATAGQVLLLDQANFDALLEEHPRVGVKLLRRMARLMSLNLRKTSAILAELLQPGD